VCSPTSHADSWLSRWSTSTRCFMRAGLLKALSLEDTGRHSIMPDTYLQRSKSGVHGETQRGTGTAKDWVTQYRDYVTV
jgi:hypothetical protein